MKTTRFLFFTLLMALALHASAFSPEGRSGELHYTFDPHQYANSMQIIGVPQLNGVTQLSDQLEIGAFCGNECRGSKMIEQYSGSYWLTFLTVHGNDNDIITYKVYDHATGQEWGVICQTTTTFVTNAMLGNPGSPYLFVFTSNLSITATANPTEGGTVSGSGSYDYGTTCVLTATANTGYNFVNWMENGEIVSISATYSFTVSTNRTLVANFAIPQQNYTINVSANPSSGGTVTGGGTFQQGQTCTLTASPNSSFNFVCWMENDIQVSTDANYTFTVTGDRNLVAQFQIRTYTIATTVFPAGTGMVTGSSTYSLNEPCTLTATANEGYAFVNWTENGTQVSTNATYSFTVTSDRTLVANFTDLEGGQLNGLFSVSGTVKVAFSQGNLQVGGLNNSYRFADHQWDYVGEYNTGTGYWRDLFTSSDNSTWGNTWQNILIRNGGNTKNIWRMMTQNEWDYLLHSRVTTSGILYAKACVNYINGVILLPDDWDESYYSLNNTNSSTASFSDNTISATQWNSLEQHGAVFLPAAGYYSSVMYNAGSNGYYWSSTYHRTGSSSSNYHYTYYYMVFSNLNSLSYPDSYSYRYYYSVRMVRNMYNITVNSNPEEGGTVGGAGTYRNGRTITLTATPNTGYTFANWTWNGNVMSTDPNYTFTVNSDKVFEANFLFNATTYTISATANPTEGGTVTGGDVYNEGATCTLTATANTGYVFSNWTKDGIVVSTDASYTFTVTENSNYVANFSVVVIPNYTIIVAANPTNGGMVSGGGTYQEGSTCDITAAAANGYNFVNWTEGGNVVSTDANYSFTVNGNRALVANFEAVTGHWMPIEGTQYNMTISGIILIDNVEQAVTTLEVGAFCGNECRGSMMPEFFPPTGQYIVSLTVVSNQMSGENITFRLYDHVTQQELDLQCANSITFESNAIIGSVGNWYQFAFSNQVSVMATVNPVGSGTVTGTGTYMPGATVTLTATPNSGYAFRSWISNGETVSTENPYTFTVTGTTNLIAQFDLQQISSLPTGWSWWSTYIEMNGNNGLLQLEESLGHNGLMIKTQTPYVQNYYPSLGYDYWFGSLANLGLNNEAGYQISVSNACQAIVSGSIADAATHHITVKPGWNWIGYPVATQQGLSVALANFTPSANDLIKGQNSSATFYDNYGWFPTSFTLIPGQGYMYFSNATENKALTYAIGRNDSEIVEAAERIWTNDEHAFASNLTVMAVVAIDGKEQRSDELELGAFVGGECRGSAVLTYFEPTDRWYAMLTIAGEEGEEVNFAVIDRRKGNTDARSANRVVFVENAIVGNLDSPYEVNFTFADALRIYPNPIESNATFTLDVPSNETMVEMFVCNALGDIILHEEGAQVGKHMRGISVAGVYTVKVVCKSGNTYIGRLIVK